MAKAKKKSGASKKAAKASAKPAKKSAAAKKTAKKAAKSKKAAPAKKASAKAPAKKAASKVPSTKRAKASPPPVVENPGTAEPITHEDPAERAQDAVDQGWDQNSAAGMADEADVEDQSADA